MDDGDSVAIEPIIERKQSHYLQSANIFSPLSIQDHRCDDTRDRSDAAGTLYNNRIGVFHCA